jgi:hypothetical protein
VELKYQVGSIIAYRLAGGQSVRTVRVTNKESNIKNGRSGFDGIVVSGPNKGADIWGYDSQITEVKAWS